MLTTEERILRWFTQVEFAVSGGHCHRQISGFMLQFHPCKSGYR